MFMKKCELCTVACGIQALVAKARRRAVWLLCGAAPICLRCIDSRRGPNIPLCQ